jgi:hypothetical protein
MEPAHQRGFLRARIVAVLAALLLCSFALPSSAFSLLGPYANWMQPTNNFRMPGDIGGPMDITEAYRWNVPVLTYGFDRSFLDFFGDQGVAAVESAIQILNDLPPASATVLTNYPFSSAHYNWTAEAAYLIDLKTAALCALVEHMGLAQPQRHMFVLRQWHPWLPSGTDQSLWPPGTIPTYITERNFAPESLNPSRYVNQALFYGEYIHENGIAFVLAYADPFATFAPPVAEGFFEFNPFGSFFTNLTYDDVGGIRFLLCATNVNYETLLPDIQPANPNRPLVNGAWRPGVEKITFVSHDYDKKSGEPLPMTFRYKDTYLTNGGLMHQNVKRVVTRPDFLFSAGDIGPVLYLPPYARSGTTNWLNNASLNGQPGAAGPGIITPPVQIVFHKLGPQFITQPPEWGSTQVYPMNWGSFDTSTNAPSIYPVGTGAAGTNLTVWFRIYGGTRGNAVQLSSHTWSEPALPGGLVQLQTSTNLLNWTTEAVATNNGTVIDWLHVGAQLPRQFFRSVAQ